MKRILIILLAVVSLGACKKVEEKIFGPLKKESLAYKSLLIDSVLAHNSETVKYIEFDTINMLVKVIYDEDKGDISELEGYIERLDLVAPIVSDSVANQAIADQLKEAKTDSTLNDFIAKTIVSDIETKRLDSIKKAHLLRDQEADDSLKQVVATLDSLRKDTVGQ